jgi:uncharacterized protein YjbI with pentapeptide repeats
MADEEKTILAVKAAEGDPQGCPVGMYEGRRCGRFLNKAVFPEDKTNVCIMHTHDPAKGDGAFQEEFERILGEAGDRVADFSGFVFPSGDYRGRQFKPRCIFHGAKFADRADFGRATFTQGADFSYANFTQRANFDRATFTDEASFYGASFAEQAHFSRATFAKRADFYGAMFALQAYFREACFAHAVDFGWAFFSREANFSRAQFTQGAEFRRTRFLENGVDEPGLILSLARFERPGEVVFYRTYLGQAFLHNCDIAKIVFSDVRWRERENGKRMVFEEVVDLREESSIPLRRTDGVPAERNYSLIAELYQQLKRNYDDRGDYWTAGDWHYGEMEMKRRATPAAGRIARWLTSRGVSGKHLGRIRQWRHRHMGVAAWYKRASEYGESYARPFWWLLAVVLVWSVLYSVAGLRYTGAHTVAEVGVRWSNRCPDSTSYHTCMNVWRLAGNSLLISVEVAAFQRQLTYEPVYPWGRLARIVELVLTSTLLALFLLALRRQFRR